MDSDFDNVTWRTDSEPQSPQPSPQEPQSSAPRSTRNGKRKSNSRAQATTLPEAVDYSGIGSGILDCTVDSPLKEGEGTKDAYISYLVTTHVSPWFASPYHLQRAHVSLKTDFKAFQKSTFTARRRFTDFVFLFKNLSKDYPACAVPPLPDKHKMEYVRGDRFGPDFTQRRAHSLHRFLKRLTLHPVLRRSALLAVFLESNDWNAHMRLRPSRNGSGANDPGNSVFDNFADTFVNAFSKVHKPDKRFIEVRDAADKLDEDLGHVEKIVARVARREADLEADGADLATQFLKLAALEPGVEGPVHAFARGVEDAAHGMGALREHTDQDYLGSLRDMEAYIVALKALLRTREQKQLDFEGLTEYLAKAVQDRDALASAAGSGPASALSSPRSFLVSKLEDVRGVDHERARRERVRKLELQIERLTREVEDARRTAEMFDEEVVKEVADFERIKAAEFRDTLGGLAEKHVEFYEGVVETWEGYVKEMEKGGKESS